MSYLLPVPHIRQSTGYSCGAASLLACLSYYGVDSREDVLMSECGCRPPNGITPEGIVKAAEKRGMQVEAKEGLSSNDICLLVSDGHPVIVLMQAWPESERTDFEEDWSDGHYVVVVGIGANGRLILNDPSIATRHTTLTPGELESRWHDKDANGLEYNHMGIVFSGTPADQSDETEAQAESEWREDDSAPPSGVKAKSTLSHEYLAAYHERAKTSLPAWLHGDIHRGAMPASGGTSGGRTPQHSALESMALDKLTPDHIKDVDDTTLAGAWKQLCDQYGQVKTRKGMDGRRESYARLGSFVAQEMKARGLECESDGEFAQAVASKSSVARRIELLPDEIDLGPVACLRSLPQGLSLQSHGGVGDRLLAELKSVGVPISKSSIECELEGHWLYDMVLRKSGSQDSRIENPVVNPIVLVEAGDDVEMLSKTDAEKRVIWYAAAIPNEADAVDDVISVHEVEEECHRFLMGPRQCCIEHGEKRGLNADGRWPANITGKALVVESGLLPCACATFFGRPLNRPPLPMGTWVVAIYYPDGALWKWVSTHIHGVSWRGLAKRKHGR